MFAVREGRVGFQRLLTYAFNMLVKKAEIVLFLAIGLGMTGHAVLTPALMVLLFVTNDFLSMSLTTDRASFAASPSVWRMRGITLAAVGLGVFKLCFSTAAWPWENTGSGSTPDSCKRWRFITLVFGNQAAFYVLRSGAGFGVQRRARGCLPHHRRDLDRLALAPAY